MGLQYVTQDFRPVFWGLKYYLIHLLCKQFREIVRFSEDIRLQNSRFRLINDYADTEF